MSLKLSKKCFNDVDMIADEIFSKISTKEKIIIVLGIGESMGTFWHCLLLASRSGLLLIKILGCYSGIPLLIIYFSLLQICLPSQSLPFVKLSYCAREYLFLLGDH